MAIKYLLEGKRSAPDMYGNTYEYTLAENTETHARIKVQESASNIAYYLRNAGVDWSEIRSIEQTRIPVRQYNRMAKDARYMDSAAILAAIL